MKICIVAFLVFSCSSLVMAQPGMSFFPHHAGDVWQYRSVFTGEVVFTERFVRDSVDQIGNVFIWYNRSGSVMPGAGLYRINTVYDVYQLYTVNDTASQPLLYRLSADSGVGWTYLRSEWDSVVARVVRVFPAIVFGQQVTMKKIEYTRYPPAGGFWIGNRYLATGFGFVRWEVEPSDVYVLSGAIIDGVHYGTIVSIREEHSSPRSFDLVENYPNPFNNATIISYTISNDTHVNLTIYDMLGSKVSTVVDENKREGRYDMYFRGDDLASGMYLAVLRTPFNILTHKMLLTK